MIATEPEPARAGEPGQPGSPGHRRRLAGAAAVVVVGLAVIGGLWWRSDGSGAGAPPRLTVSAVVISEGDEVASGYLTVRNDGGPDELIGVTTDVASVSVHASVSRGGSITMVPVARLRIPAHTTIHLQPGGGHLMLEPLTRPLAPGVHVTLRLTFSRSAPATVTATVESYAQIARDLQPAPARGATP